MWAAVLQPQVLMCASSYFKICLLLAAHKIGLLWLLWCHADYSSANKAMSMVTSVRGSVGEECYLWLSRYICWRTGAKKMWRLNQISYIMALTLRSKRGEVQPKISPGERGRHCGTSTSYSGLRAALTACVAQRKYRWEHSKKKTLMFFFCSASNLAPLRWEHLQGWTFSSLTVLAQ